MHIASGDKSDLSGASLQAPRMLLPRLGRWAPVIALHLALFYALQDGSTQYAVPSATSEIFTTFVAPAPSLPKQAPPPLKTMAMKDPAIPKIDPIALLPSITLDTPRAVQHVTPATVEPSLPASPSPASVAIPSALPKTVSSVVYLRAPQPEYPSVSRRLGEQGKVVLRVLVNPLGHAEQIGIEHSSGSPRLDQAARNAVARALFKPHIEDGVVTAVFVLIPIEFQLG